MDQYRHPAVPPWAEPCPGTSFTGGQPPAQPPQDMDCLYCGLPGTSRPLAEWEAGAACVKCGGTLDRPPPLTQPPAEYDAGPGYGAPGW